MPSSTIDACDCCPPASRFDFGRPGEEFLRVGGKRRAGIAIERAQFLGQGACEPDRRAAVRRIALVLNALTEHDACPGESREHQRERDQRLDQREAARCSVDSACQHPVRGVPAACSRAPAAADNDCARGAGAAAVADGERRRRRKAGAGLELRTAPIRANARAAAPPESATPWRKRLRSSGQQQSAGPVRAIRCSPAVVAAAQPDLFAARRRELPRQVDGMHRSRDCGVHAAIEQEVGEDRNRRALARIAAMPSIVSSSGSVCPRVVGDTVNHAARLAGGPRELLHANSRCLRGFPPERILPPHGPRQGPEPHPEPCSKRRGIQATAQRMRIADLLFARDQHLTAEQIIQTLAGRGPRSRRRRSTTR